MWMRSLANQGLKPKIELVDEVSDENWIEEEQFYISYFRFLGFRLTNLTEGGEGVLGYTFKMKPDSIQKAIATRKKNGNNKMSEKNRIALTAARVEKIKRTGSYHSDEQRKRYSLQNTDFLDSIRHLTNHDASKKPIGQYDKDDNPIATFSSVREAAKVFPNHQNIMFVLKGKGKTAYGFTWKYLPKEN